jgi:hypothetical protein
MAMMEACREMPEAKEPEVNQGVPNTENNMETTGDCRVNTGPGVWLEDTIEGQRNRPRMILDPGTSWPQPADRLPTIGIPALCKRHIRKKCRMKLECNNGIRN